MSPTKNTRTREPGNRPRWRLLWVGVALLIALLCFFVFAVGVGRPNVAPVTNDGRPWRIGYLEGGPYVWYPQHLRALIDGFVQLGWMEPIELPESVNGDTRAMWQHLATHARSDYLDFVPDAYYSADWNETTRVELRETVRHRLNDVGDIDLMLAMGTPAGLDLRDGHNTPTVVISATDPIAAGIIDSAADSGRDYLHAKCDPDRYLRQIHAFHNIVSFKRIGVLSEDSPTGRVYSNVPDLQRVAAEEHFEVVVGTIVDSDITAEEARSIAARRIAELAPTVDAFWLTDNLGTQPQFLPDVIQPLLDHNVPTWSTLGPMHVRRGSLLGSAESHLAPVGLFHATVIARILNGESPRNIPQVFEDPKSFVTNRKTARRINFELPPSLELVADHVYDTIESGPVDAPTR